MQGNACRKVDLVRFGQTACAQQHAGTADFFGVVAVDIAGLLGQDLTAVSGGSKAAVILQHGNIAALCGKHLLALFKGRAVCHCFFRHGTAFFLGAQPGQQQHIHCQLIADLGQIGRAAALQHLHAFHHFQAVADVVAKGRIHIRDQSRHIAAVVGADGNHLLRQLNGLIHGFHKCTVAAGDIQQNGIAARCQLFAHNAAGDQRNAVHGGRYIPQRIHFFICHSQVAALADHRNADFIHLGKKFFLIQCSAGAGHAFHLIHRAARVAQAAAAHFGDFHAAGRHNGGDHQRGFIAHAAGGVLIHLDALNGRKIHHVTGMCHDIG